MKLKVGDKVRINAPRSIGIVERIDYYDEKQMLFVRHSDGAGGQMYSPSELELIAENSQFKFDIGDKVTFLWCGDKITGRVDNIIRHGSGTKDYYVSYGDGNKTGKWLPEREINVKEESIELRKPIKWFASVMEVKLQRNDSAKGSQGWRSLSVKELYSLLRTELQELNDAHENCDSVGMIDECADVANLCMMIAENIFSRSQNRNKE